MTGDELGMHSLDIIPQQVVWKLEEQQQQEWRQQQLVVEDNLLKVGYNFQCLLQ
jgi:hypothetical protein